MTVITLLMLGKGVDVTVLEKILVLVLVDVLVEVLVTILHSGIGVVTTGVAIVVDGPLVVVGGVSFYYDYILILAERLVYK